jgi:Transcriptional regulators
LWPVKAWKAAGSSPSSGSRRPGGVSVISTAPTGSRSAGRHRAQVTAERPDPVAGPEEREVCAHHPVEQAGQVRLDPPLHRRLELLRIGVVERPAAEHDPRPVAQVDAAECVLLQPYAAQLAFAEPGQGQERVVLVVGRRVLGADGQQQEWLHRSTLVTWRACRSQPRSARPGGSIGIDDGSAGQHPGAVTDERARAEQFAGLFRAVYLTFHRRDGPRSQLPGASRAVLEHLALAGPLTVGEAAAHMNRAQSVISEIVTHLERQGLLEREDDPADRRRTLIWLTAQGHEALRRDREVLSVDMLAGAMARLPAGQADDLIAGLRALVDLATPNQETRHDP